MWCLNKTYLLTYLLIYSMSVIKKKAQLCNVNDTNLRVKCCHLGVVRVFQRFLPLLVVFDLFVEPSDHYPQVLHFIPGHWNRRRLPSTNSYYYCVAMEMLTYVQLHVCKNNISQTSQKIQRNSGTFSEFAINLTQTRHNFLGESVFCL